MGGSLEIGQPVQPSLKLPVTTPSLPGTTKYVNKQVNNVKTNRGRYSVCTYTQEMAL